MKKALAGLALGVLLAAPALAASTIDTPAFTITYLDGPNPQEGSITLVEETPASYGFSLDTLNADLAQAMAHDLSGAGATDMHMHQSVLRIEADAGYRVTGIWLSLTVSGDLTPGQLPGFPPGHVDNAASLFMGVWTPAGMVPFGNQYAFFSAQESYEYGSASLELGPVTDIGFNGMVWAEAYGIDGGGPTAESTALASIRDVVLRVEVSPIPEPGTYAMLLAGLGVLAGAGRRRRR